MTNPNGSGRLATLLGTVIGNSYLVLGTIFWATLALLTGVLDRSGNATFYIARWWSQGIMLTSGLRVRRTLPPDFDSTGPYVYMSNHQSLFDIPLLLVSLPTQTRMLAKSSLFRIPILGWAMRLGGFISIDRENRTTAKESFDATVSRLQAGTSALIFPEGTRSLDGRILPFQRGGLLLALKSGLRIVPVGIEGTLAVQPKDSFVIRPRTLHVRYGAPIETSEFAVRDRAVLAKRVREAVADLANTDVAK